MNGFALGSLSTASWVTFFSVIDSTHPFLAGTAITITTAGLFMNCCDCLMRDRDGVRIAPFFYLGVFITGLSSYFLQNVINIDAPTAACIMAGLNFIASVLTHNHSVNQLSIQRKRLTNNQSNGSHSSERLSSFTH